MFENLNKKIRRESLNKLRAMNNGEESEEIAERYGSWIFLVIGRIHYRIWILNLRKDRKISIKSCRCLITVKMMIYSLGEMIPTILLQAICENSETNYS